MTGDYRRFAVYAMPEGALLAAGAAWLGWDSASGQVPDRPEVPGLPDAAATLTATPRKYGFHGTVKPPFRLAPGVDAQALARAVEALCARLPAVTVDRLEVRRLGGFVAMVPAAPCAALADLAARVVADLDLFRAPLTEAELARRRKSGLSPRQEALLAQWGYPYVMEEFRFHMTLTGNLGAEAAEAARGVLAAHFAPLLARAFVLDSLCLMGEDAAGRFHLIHRYPLAG